MDWEVARLTKAHDRAAFSCGVPSLDSFLRQYVSQYEKRNLGRTYVLIEAGQARVYGYYTLAGGQITKADLSPDVAKKLPNHPVPVVLLARLAVDQSLRGQGLGRELLANALARAAESAEHVGFHAVVVDAVDDTAAAFYRHNGFTPLENQPLRLYMPISAVDRAEGA